MSSRGQHPYSNYATSDGQWIYAMSSLDMMIDIAGVFFPLRSLQHAEAFEISEEHGTGSLEPYALVNQAQTHSGSFTFGSFLVNGENVMTSQEYMTLKTLLQDVTDENRAVYFDIYLFEVPGVHSNIATFNDLWTSNPSEAVAQLDIAEALIDCKITKKGREYPEKGTVVAQYDFKYSRELLS